MAIPSTYQTARNGAWRRLAVRLNRQGLIGRTRQGYYAPTTRRY